VADDDVQVKYTFWCGCPCKVLQIIVAVLFDIGFVSPDIFA
jgi:hypothetical protein